MCRSIKVSAIAITILSYLISYLIIYFSLNASSSYINNLYPGYHYDFVEIFLGNSSQTYCGDTIPGPFNNISTSMTVKFATNAIHSAGSKSGFLAAVCCDVNVTRVVISCELNWTYNIYSFIKVDSYSFYKHIYCLINIINCIPQQQHNNYWNYKLQLWLGTQSYKDCGWSGDWG